MTDMETSSASRPDPGRRPARRAQRARGPGCLIALVILAVLAGAAYWGVTTGIDGSGPVQLGRDYRAGREDVTFEVKPGDTSPDGPA
jgi:hypothetical protein